jgi:alkanesulfonate monooxygenase SsuD/methylene tetrahydromethanopterin reductase-like flavin-dependent oxidoreductase (luciferase family)
VSWLARQLVRDVALAEQAGFDFAVSSDHYFPGWTRTAMLRTRGACSVWRLRRLIAFLMTYVTCSIHHHHPAVVAQKAATMQLLSDGRFTPGLARGRT